MCVSCICVCHFMHTIVHIDVEPHFHLLAKNASCISSFSSSNETKRMEKKKQFSLPYIFTGTQHKTDLSHSRWTCVLCVHCTYHIIICMRINKPVIPRLFPKILSERETHHPPKWHHLIFVEDLIEGPNLRSYKIYLPWYNVVQVWS